MISPIAYLLLSAIAHTSLAVPQATPSLAPTPQFENVTIYANDERILYFPPCPSKTSHICAGSWFTVEGEQFPPGGAMVARNPDPQFKNQDPFFSFSFKGTAMYMFQWVNASTALQTRFLDTSEVSKLDLLSDYPPDPANPGQLRLVLAWKLENLDPTKTRKVGVQRLNSTPDTPKQIIIDRIVVTRPAGADDDPDAKRDSNKGGKLAGGIVGSILGLSALSGIAYFVIRRRRAQKAVGQKHNWEGTGGGITQKFGDPSAEIMQSERLAREGRLEEQKDPKGSPPMPTLPPIT